MDSIRPVEPYWHLAFIAMDPVQQSEGYGSTLLEHTLEVVDRDKKIAYLESTNEANLTLKRHGFELVAHMQAGSSPPLFSMIRQPR